MYIPLKTRLFVPSILTIFAAATGCSLSLPAVGAAPNGSAQGGRGNLEVSATQGAFIREVRALIPPGGDPSPVEVGLYGASPCEVAFSVLRGELGQNVSCSFDGPPIDLQASLPGDQLALLVASVLRSSGAAVSVDGDLWVIRRASGGSRPGRGERVGGFSGSPPPDASVTNVSGANAFTIASENGIVARTARPTTGSLSSLTLPRLGADEVVTIAEEIGVAVVAVPRGEGVLLFGSQADLEAIESLVQGRPSVVVVPVGSLGDDMILGAADRNYVMAEVDTDRRIAVLSGDVQSVRRASRELGLIGGDQRGYSIQAVFWRGEVSRLDSFGIEAGVSLDLGDVLVGAGLAANVPFAAFVDYAASATTSVTDLRPSVAVSSGSEASFSTGQEVPFSAGTDDEGRSDIEYRTVGSILTVTPMSLPGNMVRVAVRVEVSTVDGEGFGGNPVFGARTVDTTVDMRRGQVLLLSGFRSRTESRSRGRFLGLPNRSDNAASAELSVLLSIN
jgi:hypothetical protein|tara:strand:+ start:2329 stop:3843 length:1515 start_codon:yes stop_codon:yes gene_type:complete